MPSYYIVVHSLTAELSLSRRYVMVLTFAGFDMSIEHACLRGTGFVFRAERVPYFVATYQDASKASSIKLANRYLRILHLQFSRVRLLLEIVTCKNNSIKIDYWLFFCKVH